ncbi:MAG: tetratricopeptide repeat protein [Okeania sp. SIO2G4]|uniref:tetratricopeptide repeat protein n=1 Tax=unclassified Okeania TaxID=2634635 RepID=UPI0013BBFCB1|nr:MULTISPECIES: tetratricopeptide repeat protein [unclassified Okeania]NEP08470.1 tetratricopeptide repeat protein [Okeania sp. SIO4D6]NEP37866.1 tetratricopeptide repeat protein [Okeania sp. SIO2H7]NEP71442.1 tetratricopeptide repeat protein [Okeania sp. SIO2G5]NEP93447.1 tetratricopeptide repeat protein [Okeania sp. SIO2F5]NEQ89744.1 tetratricopeptide repeat protein [Okeania sp. SIO2G4]
MRYWRNYLGVIATALALSFPTFEGLHQGEKWKISPVFAQDISYGNSNSESEISRLLKEGEEHYQNEQYEQALEKFQQVLKLRRDRGDLLAESRALFYVGATYEKLGDIEKVQDYYWEVLGVAEEMVDPQNSKKTNSLLCKTPEGRERLKDEKSPIKFDCFEEDSGSVTLLFDEDDKKESE